MFKKIEAWVLYLVIVFSLLFTIGFAGLVHQEIMGTRKLGKVSKFAVYISKLPVQFLKIVLNKNEFMVVDRFPELEGFSGEPHEEKIFLLLSSYNLDLKQSIVELVDLRNFTTLHTWNPKFNDYNKLVDQKDEFRFLDRDKNDNRSLAHHPFLTQDGGLLINDGVLNKIDSCSNLIWQSSHDWFHHSLEVDSENNIWVPTHLFPSNMDKNIVGMNDQSNGGFLDDAIVKISNDGKIIFEKSVSQIFMDNQLEPLLFSVGIPNIPSDPIHLNDIQPVLEDSAFMRKGDVFLSFRHQSMIILYRPETDKIIWKGFGVFFHQHDVDILSRNKISIFNNNSKNGMNGAFVDGHNEVIVYDFLKNEYSSYMKNSLALHKVKTQTQGLSEILPNGDLFIEETNFGRTLYFNRDGQLKWSYLNRSSDGKVGTVAWSRLLHTPSDLLKVKNFLASKVECND